jgi:Prealbumin-like fold domain
MWLCRVVLAGALVVQAADASACSLRQGYFYQVTQLLGTVVGRNNYWALLEYRSYPRWLRQRTVRGKVDLRLYEYRSWRTLRESHPIATVRTDENGKFNFGALPTGHYTLVIDWPDEYGEIFDVEIKSLPVETTSITIDVSPVDPDCTGGHEFIVRSR